ncbi:MAG: aldo/keto reductase, partial [Cytophagales bacterium]|nr:aldo/keto reductase [Cytophagales bacterium]
DLSKIDEEKATEMLRYAIDNGLNYIDTAYPYHGKGMGAAGESEPFVAKALKDGYREKVKLATKLPTWLLQSKQDMDTIFAQQLERLQTDYIDYYLVHALNNSLWSVAKKYDFASFLDKVKKDGKIKYTGFSFHDDSVKLFKEIVDAYDWDFCQIQYNYMDENYQAGKEGFEYAVSKGMGIVVMEPLKGGSLAVNLPESAFETFKNADAEKTPAEWSLRWLWNNKDVCVVLSGMSTLEQVVENVRVAKDAHVNSLSENDLEAIKHVKSILTDKVKVDCTACGYCMPCPHGVDIPRNFSYYNDFFRFDDQKTKMNAKIMYSTILSEEEQAKACTECGVCVDHCPQGIPIPDKMKEVVETMI